MPEENTVEESTNGEETGNTPQNESKVSPTDPAVDALINLIASLRKENNPNHDLKRVLTEEDFDSRIDFVTNVLKISGINIDGRVLRDIITGFEDGVDWTLRQFQQDVKPPIYVGTQIEGKTINRPSMIALKHVATNTSEPIIVLPISLFGQFAQIQIPKNVEYPKTDLDVKMAGHNVRFSIKQFFADVGVEETLHWLQEQGVGKLTPIPSDSADTFDTGAGTLDYYRGKPHETEALEYRDKYFRENYPSSPLYGLLQDVKTQTTSKT